MTIKKADFVNVNPREIDFVTRFAQKFAALQELIGVSGIIEKPAGTSIKIKKATLKGSGLTASPAEATEIGYTDFTVRETPIGELNIEKYRKGVSIESINTYGYDVAVQKTDDAFLAALQSKITDDMYSTLISAGTAKQGGATLQATIAKAKAEVIKAFRGLNLEAINTMAFVNIDDFYDYLGTAEISVQTAFGLSYVKNFLGFDNIILSEKVPTKKVLATAGNNLNIFHVDPSSSDFAKAGLQFATDGEANLIGYHVEGNYGTAVSDAFAIMGITIAPEYANGLIVASVTTAS